MADGRITEHGTFDEMMANRGDFARTFDEFVTRDQKDTKGEKAVDLGVTEVDENAKERRAAKRGAQLMQAEERNVGAVNAGVYKQYFESGNGLVLLPIMFVTIVLTQTSLILSSYWCVITIVPMSWESLTNAYADRLVWWQDRYVFRSADLMYVFRLISYYSHWPQPQGFYVCVALACL